jgi:CheY-like chemotaxis protein
MVVDDEDLLRELLAEQLDEAGYDVLVAANGTEALALLTAGEVVDVLISDLSMPGMNGIALIRAAQEARPGLPAVLLTGYTGDGASFAVGEVVAGSYSLVRKPIHLKELVDRVESLLAARERAAG